MAYYENMAVSSVVVNSGFAYVPPSAGGIRPIAFNTHHGEGTAKQVLNKYLLMVTFDNSKKLLDLFTTFD